MKIARFIAAGTICAAFAAGGAAVQAETIFALNTANQLYSLDSATPGTSSLIGLISLSDGTISETPLGIDLRATDNTLYALGDQGGIFTINRTTGAATFLSRPYPAGTISTAAGTYDIDFNPAANALRIINSGGQNLRVGGGAALNTPNTDGAYPAGTVPVGTAYANNFAGATSTTQYVLDDTTDSLIQVTVPNTPATAGSLTNLGTFGFTLTGLTPFDISQTGLGYASVGTTLYSVNVATGSTINNRATALGSLGTGALKGLAVAAAVPEPGTFALALVGMMGLAGAGLRRRRK